MDRQILLLRPVASIQYSLLFRMEGAPYLDLAEKDFSGLIFYLTADRGGLLLLQLADHEGPVHASGTDPARPCR
ncbi:hypothetical protein GEO21_15140 [Sphingobacterium faecium]|uniref:hypothetical protein n=1 Tax=Sphingobacterium faecium TaxID=34087 RepID=UPI001291D354|nr:hypothetical protein [Sphingobacterium faecium]MQP28840.1 hypothetical protein [Sphingobacterium faecium]